MWHHLRNEWRHIGKSFSVLSALAEFTNVFLWLRMRVRACMLACLLVYLLTCLLEHPIKIHRKNITPYTNIFSKTPFPFSKFAISSANQLYKSLI